MTATMVDSRQARENWRELLDAATAGEDVVIARFGKPVTAMIAYDDYLALVEELDDLRAAKRAEAILDDLEAGRTEARPLAAIKADLIAEGLLDD